MHTTGPTRLAFEADPGQAHTHTKSPREAQPARVLAFTHQKPVQLRLCLVACAPTLAVRSHRRENAADVAVVVLGFRVVCHDDGHNGYGKGNGGGNGKNGSGCGGDGAARWRVEDVSAGVRRQSSHNRRVCQHRPQNDAAGARRTRHGTAWTQHTHDNPHGRRLRPSSRNKMVAVVGFEPSTNASSQRRNLPAKTPGMPWRLCTPHVSSRPNVDERYGVTYLPRSGAGICAVGTMVSLVCVAAWVKVGRVSPVASHRVPRHATDGRCDHADASVWRYQPAAGAAAGVIGSLAGCAGVPGIHTPMGVRTRGSCGLVWGRRVCVRMRMGIGACVRGVGTGWGF